MRAHSHVFFYFLMGHFFQKFWEVAIKQGLVSVGRKHMAGDWSCKGNRIGRELGNTVAERVTRRENPKSLCGNPLSSLADFLGCMLPGARF